MMISDEFDISNKKRRERVNQNALKTAKKLNKRMSLFLDDINRNASLTKGQKNTILAVLKQ